VTSPLLAALLLVAPPAAVSPARARPGDAVLVTVSGQDRPQATLLERPLHFYDAGAGRWQALAAVPLGTATGPAPLRLADQEAATLEVEAPDFRSTTLTLPPGMVKPPASARPRLAADAAALTRAYAQPFEPPLFTSFDRPRQAEVSGRFGDQRVYNGTVSGVHNGLDLVGRAGDAIEASGDGRVVLVRNCYLSGWTTLIWHGAGVYSAYLHQSKVEVQPGQLVRRGQRIGRIGSTGRSTGPHLHWGVKVDGLWVDPESMLRLDLGTSATAVAAGEAEEGSEAATPNSTPTSTSTSTSTPTPTEPPPSAPRLDPR
jgi:murein DD-endopeptidase MepM/ murein hydrolase activator NlpD